MEGNHFGKGDDKAFEHVMIIICKPVMKIMLWICDDVVMMLLLVILVICGNMMRC